MTMSLADLGGACPAHAPPMGPNSFVFTYIFTEKCPCWRSSPPPNGYMSPSMGNPGSATACLGFVMLSLLLVVTTSAKRQNFTKVKSFERICSGGSRISSWGGGRGVTDPLGANLRCGCFLVKTFPKMKELGPVGVGVGNTRQQRQPWIRQ